MRFAVPALALGILSMPSWGAVEDANFHLRRGEPDLAYAEFRKAAESGDVAAARSLGLLLHRGMEVRGGGKVSANPAEAAKWFRVGAEGGDKVSAELLGVALCGGRGGEAKPAEALDWFRKAGLDMAKAQAGLDRYPVEDRAGLVCWQVAFEVARKSEERFFDRKRRLPKVNLTVIVDAAKGRRQSARPGRRTPAYCRTTSTGCSRSPHRRPKPHATCSSSSIS